jgi:hypothetical protein
VPYDPTDPRSQLSTAGSTASGVPRAAGYREIDASPADEQHPNGSRTWWTRSQAMVIGFTSARPGDDLVVEGIDGEHVVLVLDGAAVRIDHRSGAEVVGDAAVVIVPAGTSTVHVDKAGTVIRLLATTTAPQLASRCANAGEYAEGDGNVAEFVAWPDPPSGDRIRVHRLSDHPLEEGRLGRIFRCTTLMVNAFGDDHRPRDPTKLSPHHHDDFEQVSLQLDGDYVHHMRAPWTPDSSTWRDDEHRQCAAPAVVVIPPPLIHTSQAVGEMRHWLIDVFAPPRLDFSQRPGWVLNADEYPMPSA